MPCECNKRKVPESWLLSSLCPLCNCVATARINISAEALTAAVSGPSDSESADVGWTDGKGWKCGAPGPVELPATGICSGVKEREESEAESRLVDNRRGEDPDGKPYLASQRISSLPRGLLSTNMA